MTTNKTDDTRPALFLFTPYCQFTRPYFERLLTAYRITSSCEDADYALMLSTTDIYSANEGSGIDESAPLDTSSQAYADEQEYSDKCHAHGLPAAVLRCSNIVGTGMNGFPRMIAESIYRGTYVNISGNKACRSVIHATSLPDAAHLVIGHDGAYNVTDRRETPINDLADALAWRMAQKRILSLKPRWSRMFFGKRKFSDLCRNITFSSERLAALGDFDPVSTVDYLKTHVYDDESL